MKKKVSRILTYLRHTYGVVQLSQSEDACHMVVTARLTRVIDFSRFCLYLRMLTKAAALECEIENGGGCLLLTFHVAERAKAAISQ